MPWRAAIFDIDGTLLDNMPFHVQAFDTFLGRHGLPPLTAEDRHRNDGKRNSDIFPQLFDPPRPAEDILRMIDEKESLYRELSRGRLRPLPGLLRLLDALAARGVPVAAATSAPAENVAHNLRELGLTERFARVVRSDDVGRGKPHPDVFLAAARALGAAPEACLAFEDAPAGVAAARAAGMTCVAITTSYPAAELASYGAAPHHVVSDYDEFLAGPGRCLLEA